MLYCNAPGHFWCFSPSIFIVQVTDSKAAGSSGIAYSTDRPGADLPGMPIIMDCGADTTDCAALCDKRSKCKSWAASTCQSKVHCWLKHGTPGARPSNCRVSIFIMHRHVSDALLFFS
jgi:hypothetical protein